jgi:hypothetical protein
MVLTAEALPVYREILQFNIKPQGVKATVMYKSSVGYIKDEFLIPLYTTENDEEVTPEDEIVTLPPLDIPQSTYELLRAWIDNATVG